MTIKFWLGAILSINSLNAFAINPASPTAIADIQKQIYAANGMDLQIGIAVQAVNDAERLKLSPEKIDALKKQVEREKAKKNAALTKAIHTTIIAYGLESNKSTGKSVMPGTRGREISWLPLAREMEAHEIESIRGARNPIEQPRDEIVGITYPDGTTFMDPSAFLNGPGYLASFLLHERIHFEQITTDGKANKLTLAKIEEEAYQAQVDNALIFFNPKNRKELRLMQDIERSRDERSSIVKQEEKESKTLKGRMRALLPFKPAPMFEGKGHTNEELADISGLVAQARSQAEIARVDREKREARAREAAEVETRRSQDRRLRDLYLDIAARSCSSPGSVSQDELDNLPDPHGADFKDSYPEGVSDCVVRLFYQLHRGINANDLREASAPVVAVDGRAQPPAAPIVSPQAVRSFRATLYGLKNFAVAACGSTAPMPVEEEIVHPSSPLEFNRNSDDLTANFLAEGLGTCESLLFRRMIELIRAGQSRIITGRWAQEAAAGYRTPVPSSYVTPSPPVRGKRCEDFGNKYCPK